MGIVDSCVSRALEAYLEENPKEAKNIISKIIYENLHKYQLHDKTISWFEYLSFHFEMRVKLPVVVAGSALHGKVLVYRQ